MIKNNPFDGDSYFAQFSCIIYHQFKTRKSVTYSSVMAEFMNLSPKDELPYSVSKCEGYGELKKAFSYIKKMIEEKFGGENFIEKGNNRNREYYYVGKDPDPLVDMINAKTINDLKQYWQFCQDSAGFFPTSWLEHFFRGCRDLISIKSRRRKGELVLSASLDRSLTNIDLLPDLYEAIVSKTVLSIDYKPYEENNRILTFHPHYLKEFNGRWFLFGHADGELPEYGFNVAIDRIMGKPHKVENIPYVSAPSGFYLDFFKNIIGVSHFANSKVETIRIRAHTKRAFMLTETKKIHDSQQTLLLFGKHNDGVYGEFSIRVEVNNEFLGRILQMGPGLEIVSPENVRKIISERINDMKKLYE